MGKTDTGPVSINPVKVTHPMPFKDGYPTDPSRYNTATEFLIEARFADDVEIVIRHDGDNGILFEGSRSRMSSATIGRSRPAIWRGSPPD